MNDDTFAYKVWFMQHQSTLFLSPEGVISGWERAIETAQIAISSNDKITRANTFLSQPHLNWFFGSIGIFNGKRLPSQAQVPFVPSSTDSFALISSTRTANSFCSRFHFHITQSRASDIKFETNFECGAREYWISTGRMQQQQHNGGKIFTIQKCWLWISGELVAATAMLTVSHRVLCALCVRSRGGEGAESKRNRAYNVVLYISQSDRHVRTANTCSKIRVNKIDSKHDFPAHQDILHLQRESETYTRARVAHITINIPFANPIFFR